MKKRAAILALLIAGSLIAQTVRLEGPPRISDANLVGYWRFDEGTGTSVADFSGNGYNGAFDGTWTRGRYESAGTFVAASHQKVSVGDKSALNMGTSNFSVSLWARVDATAAMIIASKYDYSGGKGYFVATDATGKWYGKVRDASTNVSVLGGQVNDGKWHLLVMTVDRSNPTTGLKLYIDGAYSTQGQQGGGNIDNTASFYIGCREGEYYFTGSIDDFRIWKRILDPVEIKRAWEQSSAKTHINGESLGEPLAF